MILYVNGCSHTAAAEAVNPHAFACDDPDLWRLGRRPHPDNERVSWGYQLSNLLGSALVNQSESASSNDRILRTTTEWINRNPAVWDQLLVIVQWSTWERQEWLIQGEYCQINASGMDDVPPSHQDRYREFVMGVDWDQCTNHWHDQIWQLHQRLLEFGIRHVFFNGNNDFSAIRDHRSWESSYLDPYNSSQTFDQILRRNDFETVNTQSWHFGADAHRFWAGFMLQYCIDQQIIDAHAISTD